MPFGLHLIFGVILLLFGVLFVIIPFVIARIGGWAALAAEYRLSGRFEGMSQPAPAEDSVWQASSNTASKPPEIPR